MLAGVIYPVYLIKVCIVQTFRTFVYTYSIYYTRYNKAIIITATIVMCLYKYSDIFDSFFFIDECLVGFTATLSLSTHTRLCHPMFFTKINLCVLILCQQDFETPEGHELHSSRPTTRTLNASVKILRVELVFNIPRILKRNSSI